MGALEEAARERSMDMAMGVGARRGVRPTRDGVARRRAERANILSMGEGKGHRKAEVVLRVREWIELVQI